MTRIENIAKEQLDWDKLNNCTILISGGTGFIGSYIIDVLKYRNEKFNSNIKVISLSRRGGISNGNIRYIKSDITKDINIQDKIDYILHLASNTHPKQYEEDPVGTIATNILGCNNLLKLAVKNNVKRFLLASSVEIYGQCIESEIYEDYCGYINCNNARSGYNESKRTCEALCQSYIKQYGVDCVTARLARVFGPDKKEDTKAISQFLNRALANEDVILNSYGKQRYSFIYVLDAVSGILRILLNGKCGEAYNLAGDDEGLTLGEYAEYIASLSNNKVIYDIKENPSASKIQYALLNCDKLKQLGWHPNYSIKDALKETFAILKNQNNH